MKKFDLVSFGDTVVDFTPAGKTNKGTNLYERNPGGSTSNVACGVSRLGKKVAVMSAVGDDVIGHYLSQVLVENNVDVSSLVFTPNYSTFLAFVDIDETGNRTFYSLSNGVNDASLRGFTLNDVDKQMDERAAELMAMVGLNMPADTLVSDIDIAGRQMLEIARAINLKSKIIILDEPTSSLSDTETEKLFNVVNELKREGVSFIFVSHRLNEVLTISDVIYVLKDGELVTKLDPKTSTEDDIVRNMVGRNYDDYYNRKRTYFGEEVFSVEHLSGTESYQLARNDDFFNALLNLLRREVEQDVQLRIHSIAHRAKIAPDPLMSLFTDDCIKLGKEYSIGGARYSIHGLLLTGVSNTVDSLASIKKLVFEEGKYTLREFAEAMRTNYAGKEIMRQEVLNRVPKFGNDQPYVDNIASELLGKFSDIIDEVSNKYKSEKQYLVAGIGTFQFALKFGNMIGASADGRLAQETLASNYSPFHGVDVSGPTASIRSITTPNLLPYVMGAPLDLEINPNEIIGEEGLNRMVGLIKAFKELGGLMLTLTGVSKEKLLDAQKNPEKYRSLRVRLGGFSAYFTMLTKEMQDSIIQRTSHTF